MMRLLRKAVRRSKNGSDELQFKSASYDPERGFAEREAHVAFHVGQAAHHEMFARCLPAGLHFGQLTVRFLGQ